MVVCGYEFFLLVFNSTYHSFAALTRELSRNSISTRAYVLFSIYHILQLFSTCTMKVVS